MAPPASLPTRPLGKNGPHVPRLGLGLMGISVAYGKPAPDAQRLALLDKAYEMGEIFWDTCERETPRPPVDHGQFHLD